MSAPTLPRPSGERTLWLVRHGHTVVHDGGGVAGRTDVALSARGRRAVEALGLALARHLDASGAAPAWHASPLVRTRDTAAALRAAVGHGGCPLALDERLVELDFGDWEGSTWEAVHREHGALLAAWSEDWVTRAPPGGESFEAQSRRCGVWFDEAIAGTDGDAVVVTHGGTVRALACRLLGWPLDEAMRLEVAPASVCRFDRDPRLSSGWRLAGANLDDFG